MACKQQIKASFYKTKKPIQNINVQNIKKDISKCSWNVDYYGQGDRNKNLSGVWKYEIIN